MHTTTSNHTVHAAHRSLFAGAALALVGLVAPLPATVDSYSSTVPSMLHDAFHSNVTSAITSAVTIPVTGEGPHAMQGDIADVLVRVRGGAFCSGTPISGTLYVVTAAHCVIDHTGRVAPRTVVRDGVTYEATEVLVDIRYVEAPSPALDAAVLVLDQPVPGPSASLGRSFPTSGSVTLAGFQAIDTDGTLLRGYSPHDAPMPTHATGDLIEIESAPAGCTHERAEVSVMPTRVDVPCGLIPGASGGGLLAPVGDSVVLVGIVSTVAPDLSSNGVVPLDSIHELMSHPEQYRHSMSDVAVTPGVGPHTVLS